MVTYKITTKLLQIFDGYLSMPRMQLNRVDLLIVISYFHWIMNI